MNFNVCGSKTPTTMSGHSTGSGEMNTIPAALLIAVLAVPEAELQRLGAVLLRIHALSRIWVFPHVEMFQSQTLTPVSSVILGSH